MSDEFAVRALLVGNRVNQLTAEAQTYRGDPAMLERVEAIHAEVDTCLASLHEIREEQLIAMLPKPKVAKKRWWRR